MMFLNQVHLLKHLGQLGVQVQVEFLLVGLYKQHKQFYIYIVITYFQYVK